MVSFGSSSLSARRVLDASLLLTAAALLVWISAACLFLDVEHEFSGEQIHQGRFLAYVHLPGRWDHWPGESRLQVLETGQLMAPRVADRREILAARGGAYALRSRGLWKSSVLYFTATDGSDPRQNGRRYIVRYPRRQLPASMALLLASWIILPLVAFRYSRRRAGSSGKGRASLDIAAWSVVVTGSLYTLFAVQAWLPQLNVAWFMAIVGVALPLFLRSLIGRELRLPAWSPWIAGLVA
ncbi:MAG TPA: hypothetical protein VLF66_16300, partial [Thermoanaerobaculia bacterium]|nr:hypothetical protein [Thermoanaerobaculia bacterium]